MDETNKHLTQVVAGVNVKYINNMPYVLLGLKPRGEWEFPGGKVEGVESHQGALEREWMEELGVNIYVSDERFGHARNGIYDVWFYEVEIDEYDNEEPIAKEHVEVEYFRLDDIENGVTKVNMNETNKVMMNKLINKYK